jgi:hypothetical protein
MEVPETYRAELMCSACGECSIHELDYAGRLLVSSRCTSCGHVMERDVRHGYAGDLRQRVVSKPARMLRRFRRHPLSYTLALPGSIAAKPIRMLDELQRVLLPAVERRQRDARRRATKRADPPATNG